MGGDRPRETGVPFGLLRRQEPAARFLRVVPGLSLAAASRRRRRHRCLLRWSSYRTRGQTYSSAAAT